MDPKNLKELIDAYGEFNRQEKNFRAKKEMVREQLDSLGLKDGTYEADKFSLTIGTQDQTEIDPEEVFRILRKDDFFKVVKVLKEKLDEFLPKAKIAALAVTVGHIRRFRIEKRK